MKAPRALTHAKRLYGPEPWLARIRQGLSILGPKRGVLLVQLPPSAAVDHARLAFFLERVPEGLRVCIEFRNETWLQDSTFGLLEEHKAAYCGAWKTELQSQLCNSFGLTVTVSTTPPRRLQMESRNPWRS